MGTHLQELPTNLLYIILYIHISICIHVWTREFIFCDFIITREFFVIPRRQNLQYDRNL